MGAKPVLYMSITKKLMLQCRTCPFDDLYSLTPNPSYAWFNAWCCSVCTASMPLRRLAIHALRQSSAGFDSCRQCRFDKILSLFPRKRVVTLFERTGGGCDGLLWRRIYFSPPNSVALLDTNRPTMSPNRPRTELKISTTRILTNLLRVC